ncbi:MAG: hypothetical protein RI573_15220, partial [Balneolaceae bacterium]|nr:hypothetical protein [Balneolaceae bacterium]
MDQVRDDVTRPDTADLEVPKPEEKEPEQGQTEVEDQDTHPVTEDLASADVSTAQQSAGPDAQQGERDEQIAQTDTDTTDTEMDEGQMQ